MSEEEDKRGDAEGDPREGQSQEEELGDAGPKTGELKKELEREKARSDSQEKKIQYLLADFENLKKRAEQDVQNRVDSITDGMMLKFLSIYDDFVRARDALSKQDVNTEGLDAI